MIHKFTVKNWLRARAIFLGLLLAACGAQRGQASYYLQEGFNYQTGVLGTNSPWVNPTNATTVVAGSLTLPTLAGFAPDGNKAYIQPAVVSPAAVTYRPLSTQATNGAVYYAFLIDFPATPGNFYIGGLTQSTNATAASASADPLDLVDNVKTGSVELAVRAKGGTSAYVATKLLTVNTTNLVVLKYNFTNGTASIFINPTPGSTEPATPDGQSTTTTIVPDLTYVYLRAGSSTAGNAYYIDNLRVASTWAEVTPVGGNPSYLAVSLPGQTFVSGTGNTGTVATQTAGALFDINLTAVGIDGITVATNYNGTHTISYSGPGGTPIYNTSVYFTNGLATAVPVTLTQAATNAITATDGTLPGIASSPLTVIPAAIAAYTVANSPPPLAQNEAFTVSITAYDLYSNLVTAATGTNVTLSSSSTTLSFAANPLTLTNGVASTTATDSQSETLSISATDALGKTGTDAGIAIVDRKLLFTLPGQTFTAGSGNTGTPTTQTAGVPFTATIRAVDSSDDLDATYTGTNNLIFSGPLAGTYSPTTAPVVFTNGVGTVSLTFDTATNTTISTTDGTRGALPSSVVEVNPAAFSQLQLLLPGQTLAPGTITGISGTPATETAGVGFNITVIACDAFWNPVSTTDQVGVTATGDNNAILPGYPNFAGSTLVLSVTNVLAGGGKSLSAIDISNFGGIAAANSANYTVNVGPAAGVLLLAPGETATPSFAPGKTGTPNSQYAGVPYSVTVQAVDAWWNVVSNSTDTIGLTSSDTAAGLPAAKALVGGTVTLSVTNHTAGTVTLTAADSTQPSFVTSTSTITITPVPKYETVQSGNWEDTNIWQSSLDGTNWSPALSPPSGLYADTILVSSNDAVTINANISLDQLTIAATASLTVATNVNVTVDHDTGADLDVFGTVTNIGTLAVATNASSVFESASLLDNAGTVTSTNTTLSFLAGALYQHDRTGGTIPFASWDTASTCAIIGIVSTAPTDTTFNQSFGNFTWNCPGQTAEISLVADLKTIKGVFKLMSTGTSQLDLAKSSFTTTENLNYAGDMIISGGTLYIYSSSATAGTINVNLGGNLMVTGGTLAGGTGAGISSLLFTNNATKAFLGGGTVSGTIAFAVASGSSLDLGTNILTGTGSFTLNSGAGLMSAAANGLSGNLNLTTVNLGTGGNFIFDGTMPQITGTVFPATVNNLTISNATGVTLSGGVTVNGTLALNGNALNAGGNALALAGATTMDVNNNNGIITGGQVIDAAAITYGGSLSLNLTGNALTDGTVLTLFGTNGYGGGFTNLSPAIPAMGLEWDNKLAQNGTLIAASLPTVMVVTNATATVAAGSTVTFVAEVTGTAPLTIQWYDPNFNPLPGATNASLTLSNVQTSNAGNYTVTVNNDLGSDYATAMLTVTSGSSPTITSTTFTSGSGFQLGFGGSAGQAYSVLASTNLATTNWTVIATGTFGATNALFIDAAATNYPSRFYRVTLP